MSQRNSGYARVPLDLYVTPQWVFDALYRVEPWARDGFDCSPINAPFDFLATTEDLDNVCSNPPYKLATKFTEHALRLTKNRQGKVALLLPMQVDAAHGRRHLYEHGSHLRCRYLLTKRIQWANLPQTNRSSSNHVWMVWDWKWWGPPIMGWLP
jgi:hypothetical protein